MPLSEQTLGGFKTGMTRSSRRGGKDGAQKLWTLQNGYVNDQGDVVPRPGLRHVATVTGSQGLYGADGQLHVFYGDTDPWVDPNIPLVEGHLLRYPLVEDFHIEGDLPDGTVGQAYVGQLVAKGGMGPYTWTLVSGAIPGVAMVPTTGDTLTVQGTPT